MYTLGIHGGMNTSSLISHPTPQQWLHDAAAVLCKDGKVLAAAEEERFCRLKHVSHFPIDSIRFCLRTAGIELSEVDSIALSSHHMNDYLRMVNVWEQGSPALLSSHRFTEFAAAMLEQNFGADVASRLTISGHHNSHALSAVWQSGFQEALCVVMDGWGDGKSGMIASFKGGALEVLRDLSGIGPAIMYLTATNLLGYKAGDEYKVMGLAPYGNPSQYLPFFNSLIHLGEQGSFQIEEPDLAALPDILRLGTPTASGFEKKHADFAASLQTSVERILLHVLRHYREATNHKDLCLAGGFAQNCTANGRVIAAGLFDRVFIQPAAYDAGCAIGAAFDAYLKSGGQMVAEPLEHVYWGTSVPPAITLEQELAAWNAIVDFEFCEDIADVGAELLARGEVIAWCQGRSEFGARALGNRSILADPRPYGNRQRINEMIKKRESFRPFAPSVLDEWLSVYFDVPPEVKSLSFMMASVMVKPLYRDQLEAVTHVDGSARVQTVSPTTNSRYWNLIEAFRKRTGVPMILNTSFNNWAEPIVDDVADALNCYLSTTLDGLIIGDYLIRKKAGQAGPECIINLVPKLMKHTALVRRPGPNGSLLYELEDSYRRSRIALSEGVYGVLTRTNQEGVTVGQAVTDAERTDILDILEELSQLWSRRMLKCTV